MKDEDILIWGNKMRQSKNVGLYAGGISATNKECQEYRDFVKAMFKKLS